MSTEAETRRLRTAIKGRPRFYGWRVVGAAFVLAIFGWGLGFYGPPIYLEAVSQTKGWSVPLISSAITTHFVVGAMVIANLPRIYRRYGVVVTTRAGAILLAAGIAGWALASEPWQLFAATVLSGAGWVTMGAAAVNAIVSPWFVRGRPAALATAYNGASLGGVLFSPLWVSLIGSLGFPAATGVVGAVTVVTVWVLAGRLFSKTPEQLGLAPDDDDPALAAAPPASPHAGPPTRAALWLEPRFLTLAAGMALGLFAQIGLIAHLFSLLAPVVGADAAGLAMAGATAAAIAGRTLVGWLMPAGADRRLVMCASYGVQILGSLALLSGAGTDVVLLLTGTVLFGAGIGNATSLPPLIAQAEFAKADVGRVVALIVAVAQAAYAFAPAAFGLLRSVPEQPLGGNAYVFAAAAAIQALAVTAFLLGRRVGRKTGS
jgi:MFS family permease